MVWRVDIHYTLLVSEGTLAEIEDVVTRPKVRNKFQLTDEAIQQLVHRLERGERIVVEEVPAVARDPKDDIFLACAVVGKAQYIVSEDQDLLVLNPYKDIHIVNVSDFLQVLEEPPEVS